MVAAPLNRDFAGEQWGLPMGIAEGEHLAEGGA